MPGGELAVHMIAGMSARFKAPVNRLRGEGYFVKLDKDAQGNPLPTYVNFSGEQRLLVNGFLLEDEEVGTLTTDGSCLPNEVIYTHNKAAKNTIWFFADTGEIGTASVVPTPIHDHSSVVQGGPAYGTYFSDDETLAD
jgi:hypothetical protein